MTEERVKPKTTEPIPKEYAHGQWTPTGWRVIDGGERTHLIVGEMPPKEARIIYYANGWIYDYICKDDGLSPWRHIDD